MNAELQAAAARAQFNRNAAFAPVNERICGIEVLPLTVWHVTALDAINSPFVSGSQTAPTPEQIAAFIWLVHPHYSPRSRFRRWRVLRRVAHLGYLEAVNAVVGYVNEAFSDRPAGREAAGRKSTTSYFSMAAAIIDELASEYGWPESAVLHLPLKRAFQYIACIRARSGGALFESREELAIKQAWLDRRN